MADNEELAAKVAQLEATVRNAQAEIATLKAKAKAEEPLPERKPWPKYDPTEGFRMPASAVKAMAQVVPDMKTKPGFDAHAWSQTKMGEPGGFGPPPKAEGPAPVVKSTGGWAEPVKERPRNFDLFDQMVASQVGGPNDTSKLK